MGGEKEERGIKTRRAKYFNKTLSQMIRSEHLIYLSRVDMTKKWRYYICKLTDGTKAKVRYKKWYWSS